MPELHDLDELADKVDHHETRSYVKESIAAYRAGALRAATGTLWVAVCVDIIEKFRELANFGEKSAIAQIEVFERNLETHNIDGMMKFERGILEAAVKDLEIISKSEKDFLERIRTDRNISLHPSFQRDGAPVELSPETVRSHIVNACLVLLTQPATWGKAIIEKVHALIEQDSFPIEVIQAHEVLGSRSNLGRAKSATIRNLIILLFNRLFADEPIKLAAVARIAAALGALVRIDPETTDATLKASIDKGISQLKDTKFLRFVGLMSFIPTLWKYADQGNKTRCKLAVEQLSVEDFRKYRIIELADSCPDFRKPTLKNLSAKAHNERVRALSGFAAEFLVEFAIQEYSLAESFDDANSISVSVMRQYIQFLREEHVVKLFVSINENQRYRINQVLSASSTDQLLAEMAAATLDRATVSPERWKQLFEDLVSQEYIFVQLEQELADRGIVEPREEGGPPDDDLEIPF